MLNYIPDDGYTEPAYIAEVARVHSALRFKYRPVLREIKSQHLQAGAAMDNDAFDRKLAALMAQHVKEWDLKDAKGAVLPITARNILLLKDNLFFRLTQIVLGTQASDQDPEWPDETKDNAAEEQYDSALSGSAIADVREARDEKN